MMSLEGRQVRISIDGHETIGAFSYGSQIEYIATPDDDAVEAIEVPSAFGTPQRVSGTFEISVTLKRHGAEGNDAVAWFLEALKRRPRPRAWTVLDHERVQHETIHAWTQKGVRRKLRKLMRAKGLPSVYALDLEHGSRVLSPHSEALTVECDAVHVSWPW